MSVEIGHLSEKYNIRPFFPSSAPRCSFHSLCLALAGLVRRGGKPAEGPAARCLSSQPSKHSMLHPSVGTPAL